jgi:hypothetical protein
MINKQSIVRTYIKIKFGIKGFFKSFKLEKKTVYYTNAVPGRYYTYLGDRQFGYVIHTAVGYVEYMSGPIKTNKYKYWELGMLDFKKYIKL